MTETIGQYRNNCTLVAIKEVSNKPDAEILAAFRRHNYKNNKGMWQDDYLKAGRELGLQFGETKSVWTLRVAERNELKEVGKDTFKFRYSMTIGQVLKYLAKGTFLLRIRSHLLVVRDGKVVDLNFYKPKLKRQAVDFTEVLNAYQPEKKGFLKLARGNVRRAGSKNYTICQEAVDYLRNHKDVTAEELLKNCKLYHRGYLNWDIKRGNIVEV
jgi:hypothetical protein